MQKESRQILFIAAGLGMTGLVYFMSLMLHLPFVMAIAILACCLFVFGRWFDKAGAFQPLEARDTKWYHYVVIAAVIPILGYHSYLIAKPHGDWDAWAIWNFAAKYLSDKDEWQRLHLNIYGHSNYPLCLPSVIAFFNRLFLLHDIKPVAFVVSLVVTICVPMLIYFELYRRQILLAVVILLCFAFDAGYFIRAMSQYADTLLSLFFLASILVSKRKTGDKNSVLLYSIFLAFCIWTKDEGMLLALVFIVFHSREILKKNNWLVFLAVMLLPVVAIIYQKSGPTLGSDIITGQKNNPFIYLTQWARYDTIWLSLMKNLTEQFVHLKIAIVAYLILCLISLRIPGKHFLLLLTCMLGYFMVYIITPFNLEWHLITSQDRLIHQLLPSFLFVIGDDLCAKGFFSSPFWSKK